MIGPWVKLTAALGVIAGIVLIFTNNWLGGIPTLFLSALSAYLIRLNNNMFVKEILSVRGPAGPHGDASYGVKIAEDIESNHTNLVNALSDLDEVIGKETVDIADMVDECFKTGEPSTAHVDDNGKLIKD